MLRDDTENFHLSVRKYRNGKERKPRDSPDRVGGHPVGSPLGVVIREIDHERIGLDHETGLSVRKPRGEPKDSQEMVAQGEEIGRYILLSVIYIKVLTVSW